jgi:hypothetical protein
MLTSRQRSLLFFLVISYLVGASLLATRAPVTHDEFFTLYIARLPTLNALWVSLRETLDFHPPLSYVLTRFNLELFGLTAFGLRAISVFGGLALLGGLFTFLLPRVGFTLAILGTLLPLATITRQYFFLGRSYMLMLAFTVWGYVFWSEASRRYRTHTRSWTWALAAGVALSLAGFSHYYAVLAYFPLLLAELYEVAKTRRVAWINNLILGSTAILTLIILRPFVTNAKTFSGSFWGHSNLRSVIETYQYLVGGKTFLLWSAFAVVLLIGGRMKKSKPAAPPQTLSAKEAITLAGLAGIPLVGVAVSAFSGAGFTYRYVLIAIIGLSLGLPLCLNTRLKGRPTLATALVILMSIWTVAVWAKDFRWMSGQTALVEKDARELLAAAGTDEPLVVAHYDLFMQYWFHGPRPARDRLTFLNDADRSREYTHGKNCVYAPEALLDVAQVATEPQTFLAAHPTFLCLLAPYHQPLEKQLAIIEKTPITWKVGDYQLYRCATRAAGSMNVGG